MTHTEMMGAVEDEDRIIQDEMDDRQINLTSDKKTNGHKSEGKNREFVDYESGEDE